jgi:hypothetical protein
MSELFIDAVLALAERCAESVLIVTVDEARLAARSIAGEYDLTARQAQDLLALAVDYAQTVGPRFDDEEARAMEGLLIESLQHIRSRSTTSAVSNRLLPSQWRTRQGGIRETLRGDRQPKQHRILFVAANAYDIDPVAFAEEYAMIHAQLRASRHRDDFEIVPLLDLTADALVRHMVALDPAVIHIAGRSAADAAVVFEDASRQPDPMPAAVLAHLISSAAPGVRLVVLQEDAHHEQSDRLRAVIDCVVSVDAAMPDHDARAFVGELYRGLGAALSVAEATALGVNRLSELRLHSARPRCLTKESVDARQIWFRPSRASARSRSRASQSGRYPSATVRPPSLRATENLSE